MPCLVSSHPCWVIPPGCPGQAGIGDGSNEAAKPSFSRASSTLSRQPWGQLDVGEGREAPEVSFLIFLSYSPSKMF
jgi:hypothetical protein